MKKLSETNCNNRPECKHCNHSPVCKDELKQNLEGECPYYEDSTGEKKYKLKLK